MLKASDGWFMARGSIALARRLQHEFRPNVIDAHFLFPDGYAASLLGRALGLPVTITLRGSKDQTLLGTSRERFMRRAAASAARLFSVSDSLKRDVGEKLTEASDRILVVANGVDSDKFRPVDRVEARRRFGIAPDARVIIGVGGLVKGKGFHHVIPLVKRLRKTFPNLVYLIVGGGASQGDMRAKLEALAHDEGVADAVRFCGRQLQDDLPWYYGAADLFVLATAYEGWANVLLEAMACGVPVVTTRVGGNEEVVSSPALGELVEYWDADKFAAAIERSLRRDWDRDAIVAYARSNSWDRRIDLLEREFRILVADVPERTTRR
jgi:glycosyltransferase involved in cell wall biosynthesis